ncbi:soluble quino protein glucose dehydrogenase [Cucurbitaria berberidis CBS 394.84]|uniref:Soluble quino protein glucose dehydrogenase n=1 Tax=Cucurbitaria berberidis CBS 394.84 TaxID=1168544 RepID=A0A9P4GEP1_9PLEO|nr:soluble quino protein glucose dehydrogenase [Cucurbitaria berberidis CBS 394.84]KAF1843864.1 soluble quino protein glucose dehydrogenase [Cucurbitaria berberidis CBS 394.84]
MVQPNTIVFALAALTPTVLAQTCANIDPAQAPTFAPGYSGRVVINGLQTPRGIVFDNQGNLLTTERGGYGVRYIRLTDNGGTDVCVESSKQLINDTTINHGIALSPDGKKLFVSSQLYVWGWDYDGATGTVSNKKTLVQGMQQGGFHLTRTLVVPKQRPDLLLVQRGSQENFDTAAAQLETARSQIRVFKIADIETATVEYNTGEVLAWGIRNTVAFGEDPQGGMWTVDNGIDDLTRNGKDIHNTNPCEELNYHGLVNSNFTVQPTSQTNHGYPECHTVWDPTILPEPLNTQLKVGSVFAYGNATTADDSNCASRQPPKLCFPSHTAPLDIKFTSNGTAAYIAFHGSWNKVSPDGFRISRVSFNPETGQPVEPVTSTTAAQNIMYNADNSKCPNGCFRPVGLAWDTKGRLFMASDNTNEIWVIGGAT